MFGPNRESILENPYGSVVVFIFFLKLIFWNLNNGFSVQFNPNVEQKF